VVFDVGGKDFKVLKLTIAKRPETLLAQLLEDHDVNSAEPLFVDANPDRFGLILDWYRHGVIHVPPNVSVAAVRKDADFFLLPVDADIRREDAVGASSPQANPWPPYVAAARAEWPGFSACVESLVQWILEFPPERVLSKTFGVGGEEKIPIHYHERPVCLLKGRSSSSEEWSHNIEWNPGICWDESWFEEARSFPRLRAVVAGLQLRGFDCRLAIVNDLNLNLCCRVPWFPMGREFVFRAWRDWRQ